MKKFKTPFTITAAFVVAALLWPKEALAVFGIEDTVELGPVSYTALWSTVTSDADILTKAVELGKQTAKIVTTGTQMYALGTKMAQFSTGKESWRGFFMSPVLTQGITGVAEAEGWGDAINKGAQISKAFETVSRPLLANSSGATRATESWIDFANARIQTASTQSAMQALGTAKATQFAMQQPIAACESSTLSVDANENTNATQQNISTACQALVLRQGQTALAVETARLELETANAKYSSDARTQQANNNAVDSRYRSALTIGDTAASITNYKDR